MRRNNGGKSIGVFLGGVALGVVLTLIGTVFGMRAMMIVTYDSSLGFDETVAALQGAIKTAGWVNPNTINMNKSMAKHGVSFKPRVRLIKLCKAQYASEVLKDARHVACLMPCTMAVYETDDGSVKVSKMNTGLMGKVFGGTIARVMGGSVAADETKMLQSIAKH